MPETYVVTAVKAKGEKPNPHGGTLYKFYVSLADEAGEPVAREVYWQRKSPDLSVGEQVYGHIEEGEYGPRFKTDQRPDGAGNFKTPENLKPVGVYRQEGPDPQAERSRRIERQHSQEMAIRMATLIGIPADTPDPRTYIREWIDWFVRDLDADVGGGNALGTSGHPPAADVSAEQVPEREPYPRQGVVKLTQAPPEEASPTQKGTLTKLFHKAGLSRDAMRAVVLYRCRAETPTKEGVSSLIRDLEDGATAKQLLAEISDARAAGNPLGVRAAKLIPSDTSEWVDDGGLPPATPEPESEEEGIPF